jgi:O-antigen ligase
MAVLLALFGYSIFAGYVNKFIPEGSLGGIIIRAVTFFVVISSTLRYGAKRNGVSFKHLAPLAFFFFVYLARSYENFYLSNALPPYEPVQFYMLLLLTVIFPTFALVKIQGAIDSQRFTGMMTFFCVVFLVSIVLNYHDLSESQAQASGGRIMLEKLNSISMAKMAVSFILFYAIVFQRSKRYLVEAGVMLPPLLLIVLLSGSRSAFVSGGVAVLIYILLLKGTRRVWMILGLMLAAAGIFAVLGADKFDFMIHRFDTMLGSGTGNYDGSTQLHIQSWLGAYQQFIDDPIVGRYIYELSTGFYPHNIFLEALAATGLLGGGALLLHLAISVRAAVGILRAPRSDTALKFMAILSFSYLGTSATSGALYSASGYMISSSLVIAFWYGRKLNKVLAPSYRMRAGFLPSSVRDTHI